MALQISAKSIFQQRFALRMIHVGSLNNSLPTDFVQKSLPYLPLPKLEESISMYLERQKAVCDLGMFKTIETLANRFVQGHGKVLHNHLINCYSKDKFAYYGGRRIINSHLKRTYSNFYQNNSTAVWNVGGKDPQLLRASKLIYSVGKLTNTLRDNSFEPTVMNHNPILEGVLKQTEEYRRTQVAFGLGMVPFDMTFYPRMFGGCKIPGINTDTISNSDKSKNIVIIRNGHLYSFDLLTESGKVVDINEIHGVLKEIKEQSDIPSFSPIAPLTVLDRTSWAKYRNYLLTDPHNTNLLQIIEQSIAVLTLDGYFETGDLQKNIHLGKHPGDRWFDKTGYMSVDENSEYSGLAGNGMEINSVVGADIAQRGRHIYEAIGDVSISSVPKSATLKHLQFNVDDHILSAVKQAQKEYYAYYDKFQCESFATNEINSKEFKKRFLNPSTMANLALQIALIKTYGQPRITSGIVLVPSFINSGSFTSTEPVTFLVDIARRFADGEKLEMSSLRKCSDLCYSDIVQKRMGFNLFDEHLTALKSLSLDKDQRCEFLTSQLYEDSVASYVNTSTFPYKVANNMVYGEFFAGLALTYLFNHDGMYGGFMSIGKGPDIKEYSNIFFETMERLIYYVSK